MLLELTEENSLLGLHPGDLAWLTRPWPPQISGKLPQNCG